MEVAKVENKAETSRSWNIRIPDREVILTDSWPSLSTTSLIETPRILYLASGQWQRSSDVIQAARLTELNLV